MNEDNFPALYQSADQSSTEAQKSYLRLIILQFGLLLVAAFLAPWFSQWTDLLFVYVLIVGASSAILLYMSVRKPETGWYSCRALAESIKTSAWRYMMRADPFADAQNVHEVRREFSVYLQDILKANAHIGEEISRNPSDGRQITDKMNEVRASSLSERKEFYISDRIINQKVWYINKAKSNRSNAIFWVSACVIVQSLAIILAIARIRYDQMWNFWPIEPLLILASSILGWIQLKKFNELASAYSLTAHEIGIIESRIDQVSSEPEFSDFVNEAERAFSREHTQWVARQVAQSI